MRWRQTLALSLACAGLALQGCMANPGPPPVEEDVSSTEVTSAAPTTTTTPEFSAGRTRVGIGVQPLYGGLNPHLLADSSELVDAIADLTLPSPFHDGVLDTDFIDDAREVVAPPGVAQRVRYTINRAAQWSDGTPISGADFAYLRESMVHTPGVVAPAGYYAMSNVTTSANGQVVTVDFSTRVADWQALFDHLLPSHLLKDTPFSEVLSNGIPASAGRFLLAGADRARGVITLNRNDRYWGKNPARVDVVHLRAVSSTKQGVNMLRSGQIGFMDIQPEQTTVEYLSLLPKVSVERLDSPRQLRLALTLPDTAARRELAGLIDTEQVARLASGRTDNLNVPYGHNPFLNEGNVTLQGLGRPVVIGADPAEETSANAASVIADQLQLQGVPATVLYRPMKDLVETHEADAVVSWVPTAVTPFSMAEFFRCDSSQPFCPDAAEAVRKDILAGEMSPEQALEAVRGFNLANALYVPLLDETRVHALGSGIVGPGKDVKDWRAGLSGAAQWEME